ncbi:LacI family DNA-binding transcriptional regulator [Pseudalkalibacillus sp. JSM 102089]|uniref:LacI family DNA-binding transcriptional regulator n=1 Tax=Pseudalkalibacillus sp. JSM 102089 TaxID=3229856 RepID=UPI003525AFDF
MVTIKDVAKKAGVSTATVSAVVNKTKFVSEDLERKVVKAIDDLHYRPNRIARSLKRKQSKLIGVTVTEITNPFYPLMLRGLEQTAINAGYNVLLSTTEDNEDREYQVIESMIEQGIDGLILATVDNVDSKVLDLLEKEDIKYVLINRAPREFNGSLVCANSYEVGCVATDHLIQLGHKKIAFMGGERQNSLERERGFKDRMTANGLPIESGWLLQGGYNSEDARLRTLELIRNGELPTALFAANDTMAFGIAKAFLEEGYRIPDDVSIIGSDNIPFSEDFRIPLTTVDVQKLNIGKFGCESILKQIEEKDNFKHEQLMLKPELIVRDSTGQSREL